MKYSVALGLDVSLGEDVVDAVSLLLELKEVDREGVVVSVPL